MAPGIFRSQPGDANQVLNDFLTKDPKGLYTFDSEKDRPQTKLCRQRNGHEECISIKMNSRELFEAMQNYGFFCSLPSDPGKTCMECKQMP